MSSATGALSEGKSTRPSVELQPVLGHTYCIAKLPPGAQLTTFGTMLLYAAALYVAAGIAIGIAFVVFGVTRVLEHPAPVSAGARILLFPASAALWPLVLTRWLGTPASR